MIATWQVVAKSSIEAIQQLKSSHVFACISGGDINKAESRLLCHPLRQTPRRRAQHPTTTRRLI